MKIGLAAYECRANDVEFNLAQIERALAASGDAELVCFGEAFLQGFAAVTSDYAADIGLAVEQGLSENGAVVHNYRRISKNWRDWETAGEHYREGTDTAPFSFHGVEMAVALCGDLWIYPEVFHSNGLLIWPVYVNFDLDGEESAAYAEQAAAVCRRTLLVNPLSKDPLSRGGAFFFADGKVEKQLALDEEKVLIVETPDEDRDDPGEWSN